MLKRTLPDPFNLLEAMRERLADGKRIEAAHGAVVLSKRHAADAKFLYQLVQVLAKALDDAGDSHPKRGRPARARPLGNPRTDDAGNLIFELDFFPQTKEASLQRFADANDALRLKWVAEEFYLLLKAEAFLRNKHVTSLDLALIVRELNDESIVGTADESLASLIDLIETSRSAVDADLVVSCRKALKSRDLHDKDPQKFFAIALSHLSHRSNLTESTLQRAYQKLTKARET